MSYGSQGCSRRVFLRDFGSMSVGIIAFGLAGCAGTSTRDTTSTTPTTQGVVASTTSGPTPTTVPTSTSAVGPGDWHRVMFENWEVSAYVAERGGEAAIIDSGSDSDAEPVVTALEELGVGWDDVSELVATHNHRDHIRGFPTLAELAPNARRGIGEGDLGPVEWVGDVVGLVDGDQAFGMTVIATPGHTPGHISLLDPQLGVLFTGDALTSGEMVGQSEGTVTGSRPDGTDDMTQAEESARKLAGFDFDTIAFGHGEPITTGAKAELQSYLDSL